MQKQPEVNRLIFFLIYLTEILFNGDRFKTGTSGVTYQVLYFNGS